MRTFRLPWNKPPRPKIRVVFVPTDTYSLCSHGCDLHRLADRLNASQNCYDFTVLANCVQGKRTRLRDGLALRKRKSLVNVGIRQAAPKSLSDREKSVDTYILDTDAFEQIISHARSELNQLDEDIVIGVGGEVVVPDVDNNEFEGDAATDAYSSISIEAGNEDPDYVDDNNAPKPLQQACMISLRRINLVFPETIFTDAPERARTIVARYIILNAVGFVGNRSFGKSAWHHEMFGCLNETAWVGGERESYYVSGYCDDCKRAYHTHKVAERYKSWSADDLITAIERMLRLADKFDRVVRSSQFFLFWIQFAMVSVATNIISAMLLDLAIRWDWDRDTNVWFTHVKTHWLAGGIAALSAVTASILLGWHLRRHARLP